jgi:hypothetical protein
MSDSVVPFEVCTLNHPKAVDVVGDFGRHCQRLNATANEAQCGNVGQSVMGEMKAEGQIVWNACRKMGFEWFGNKDGAEGGV